MFWQEMQLLLAFDYALFQYNSPDRCGVQVKPLRELAGIVSVKKITYFSIAFAALEVLEARESDAFSAERKDGRSHDV